MDHTFVKKNFESAAEQYQLQQRATLSVPIISHILPEANLEPEFELIIEELDYRLWHERRWSTDSRVPASESHESCKLLYNESNATTSTSPPAPQQASQLHP